MKMIKRMNWLILLLFTIVSCSKDSPGVDETEGETGEEIDNVVKQGPNLKSDDSMKIFPPYFSLRWFFRS